MIQAELEQIIKEYKIETPHANILRDLDRTCDSYVQKYGEVNTECIFLTTENKSLRTAMGRYEDYQERELLITKREATVKNTVNEMARKITENHNIALIEILKTSVKNNTEVLATKID